MSTEATSRADRQSMAYKDKEMADGIDGREDEEKTNNYLEDKNGHVRDNEDEEDCEEDGKQEDEDDMNFQGKGNDSGNEDYIPNPNNEEDQLEKESEEDESPVSRTVLERMRQATITKTTRTIKPSAMWTTCRTMQIAQTTKTNYPRKMVMWIGDRPGDQRRRGQIWTESGREYPNLMRPIDFWTFPYIYLHIHTAVRTTLFRISRPGSSSQVQL